MLRCRLQSILPRGPTLWLDVDEYPESSFSRELAIVGLGDSTDALQADLINQRESDLEVELTDLVHGVFDTRQAIDEFLKVYRQLNRDLSNSALEALATAVDYGTLTLRATGTQENPLWDVFLSAGIGWEINIEATLREISEECADRFYATLGRNDAVTVLELERLIARNTGIPQSGRGLLPYMIHSVSVQDGVVHPTHIDWPDWLQLPLLRIATIRTSPVAVLGISEKAHDTNRSTLKKIVERPAGGKLSVVDTISDGTIRFRREVTRRVDDISETASRLFGSLFPNAPELRFNMKSPDQWLAVDSPEWEYKELADGNFYALEFLSYAQARWAQLAISLAHAEISDARVVLVIDEPERGLHPLAIRSAIDGLAVIADSLRGLVVAASHSPYLLEPRRMNVFRVSKVMNSTTRVERENLDIADDLTLEATALALGMSKSDVHSMVQRIVVVEGVHDKIVISNLLRSSLGGGQIMVPMHGAKHAHSLIGQNFLTEILDVPLLVVVDNVHHEVAEPLLSDIRRIYHAGDLEEADRLADSYRSIVSKGDEGLFLSSLLRSAIRNGALERIEIFGLKEPDIICYLSPDLLLSQPGLEWQGLIDEWKTAAVAAGKVPTNLKKWLRGSSLIPHSDSELCDRIYDVSEKMSRSGEAIPFDLAELGNKLEQM